MMEISFVKLDPGAFAPRRARSGDAGYDLHAIEEVTLRPGDRAAVRTGLAVALPAGTAGLVMPRSGLAARHGVTVTNSPGLIDSGYRGEVLVLLINHGSDTVVFGRGDRVAQLVVIAVSEVDFVERTELPDSERGAGGLGSTGM